MIRTDEVVEIQAKMMGAALYEIGLFKPMGPQERSQKTVAEMFTRTWDLGALLKSIPWLRYQNGLGRNIYVRPKGEHHLSLVDDLTWNNVERMKTTGFCPSILVETSPGNFQAWLNHGCVLPKDLSTAVARALAESFEGDARAAAWRQYGRLAGFTNRKERHRQQDGRFPFVRLIEATGRVYDEADEFVSTCASRFERIKAEAAVRRAHFEKSATHGLDARLKGIAEFRENPLYTGDGNRIDLAYAVYALAHGVTGDSVRKAIASRDLSKKGSELRQEQYIDRTIAKALARVGLSR